MNYEAFKSLTKGEQRLVEWEVGIASGFVKQLVELIFKADEKNRGLLALAFPSEVEAIENYKYTEGWWPNLRARVIEAPPPDAAG